MSTMTALNAATASIPGLRYVRDYLSDADQAAVLETVDGQLWLADLKRRVQHYGYRYDYTRRSVNYDHYLGPLPAWANMLALRLHVDEYTPAMPDQLIVNEYMPGQGIASHIDCEPCFGDTVLSISLASPCVMLLTERATRRKVEVLLEPGSLLVLQNAARYQWLHGIAPRKSDTYEGRHIIRSRRVSLTFRTIAFPDD